MSGAEAVLILSVISSLITIIDSTKKVYDAATNATGLPRAFHEVSGRLPIVRTVLESAQYQISGSGVDEASLKAIKPVVDGCEEKAKKLEGLFHKVIPPADASRLDRYFSAARTLGKGGRVETLMKGMLEDVQLLASNHGMKAPTASQVQEITKAIKDVSELESSVPDFVFLEPAFTSNNYGNGPMSNYHVQGDQYNQTNTGSGKQFQAASQVFNFENGQVIQNFSSFPSIPNQWEISNWLTTVLYKKHHRAKTNVLLPGTCTWLFERQEFQDWRSFSESSILWLHGIPGSGKSMLTSSVVQECHRESALNGSTALMAFFYCARDPAEPLRADPDEIMRCILEQLLCLNKDVPIQESIMRLYDEKLEEAKGLEPERLQLDESVKAVLELLMNNTVTIIIDALDECDTQKRQHLLIALRKLLRDSANRVKIFVSSRDDHDIVNWLKESPNLYISTNDNKEDIKKYVDVQVAQAIVDQRLLCGKVTEDLQHSIIESLTTQAHGMFRLVSLHIDALCDPQQVKTEENIYSALKQLPKKLSESYDIILGQIQNSQSPNPQLAHQILKWLMCAQKQLRAREFIESISVDTSGQRFKVTESDVLSICCNLVVLDSEQDTFRFAHLSVREYLEVTWGLPLAHAFAFERCLGIFFGIHTDHSPHKKLLFYSAEFGPEHYDIAHLGSTHQLLGEHMRRVMKNYFFESFSFSKWIAGDHKRWLFAHHYWGHVVHQLFEQDLNSEPQLVTQRGGESEQLEFLPTMYLKLVNIVCDEGFLNRNQNKSESLIVRLLELGENDLAYFMNTMGAHIDGTAALIGGATGITPLEYAVDTRNDGILDHLVKRGANCALRRRDGMSNLHMACHTGYEFAVQRFLEAGVSVDLKDRNDQTPLMTASTSGSPAIVRLLLDSSADVSYRSHSGEMALHIAAANGHLDIIKLMLDANSAAHIDVFNDLQSTALHIAAGRGDESVVQILLQGGADVSKLNREGNIPVQLAAMCGKLDCVLLLLNHEKNPDTKQKSTMKALHAAFNAGHCGIVKALNCSEVQMDDHQVHAALFENASLMGSEQHAETAEFLLRSLTNIDDSNKAGETILHRATRKSYHYLVGLILHVGAKTDLEDNDGEVALQIAARTGNLTCVQLLLQAGADIEAATSVTKHTALHRAADAGHFDVVNALVEAGADVNAEISGGETALHLASAGNFELIAALLLDKM